jgi:hypothetical protein
MDYESLKKLYVQTLKKKANILSNTYEKIYIQLTGGCDSRLVASILMEYDNIFCYCYGDGTRQDRLVSEYIINEYNLKKPENIPFAGNHINNSSRIFKSLLESNFYKFNALNTYTDNHINKNICKVTGYYGANVSGSVQLPCENNFKFKFKNSNIDINYFTHFDYVKMFKNEYMNIGECNRRDIFYVNNRGLSHYSCHSICDNKHSNSFDILYDPINLELVKKCPYSTNDIDKNAITVDLIYSVNQNLALLPYNDRIIPRYNTFKNIPDFNCFERNIFADNLNVTNFNFVRPHTDFLPFDFLNKTDISVDFTDIIKYAELTEFKLKYEYLFEQNIMTNQSMLTNLTFFIISMYYLKYIA